MEKCKKCEKEFIPQKGLISYCSLSCRNSRVITDEVKIKISEGVKNSEKYKDSFYKAIKNVDHKKIAIKLKEIWNKKIMDADFETLSFERLRKRIILEQNNKCNICEIDSWNNKPLTLELEHKDGNHFNNKRENLECICPNCHSQTKTWKGRNKINNKDKVTDDDILNSLLKNKNVRQTLIDVGLSAKGANYGRVYNLINKHKIQM